MENQENNNPTALPNATTILVLGICSIATCFCFGIVGLGIGIVALVMSKKARLIIEQYPKDTFTEGSINNMKAGKICAIIGVCLSSLGLLYWGFWLIYLLVIGAAFSSFPAYY